MAFILDADGRDDDVIGQFEKYRAYLQSVKDGFPPGAFALATSNWYFDFSDHRCPHDSWLESATLVEHSSGDRGQIRSISLRVRLLGAYHDGYIELHYPQVYSYALNCAGEKGHRDWRYDELRLSPQGNLMHEIEWCGFHDSGKWLVEASDLEFRWLPKSA